MWPQLPLSKCKKEGGIVMTDLTAKWDVELQEHTLFNITLKIEPGSLVAIVGAVGSGKSSLLNAIVGELPLESGNLHVGGTVSYAGQEPWLFAASVRQNILFGELMNPARYKQVVNVCALQQDFAMFPQGDRTIVGEKGVSLRGGQRARINLARALYRQTDIYLLDDPLSAVDAHVSAHLFHDCISKYLQGKTRILVTHQLQYLPFVDKIFVLNNGLLECHGTYSEVKEGGLVSVMGNLAPDQQNKDQADNENENEKSFSSNNKVGLLKRDSPSRQSIISSTSSVGHDSKRSSIDPALVESFQMQEPEERSHGAVGWKIFSAYFQASGNCLYVSFVFMTVILSQLFASAGDWWITVWIQGEQENYARVNASVASAAKWYEQWPPSRETSIYVYTVLSIGTIVVTLVRSFLFFHMCVRASRKLHDNMFSSITHAKMRFFYNNTSGRILNRFSKDMGAIDEVLPLCMIDTFQIGAQLFGIMILVSVINYWLIVPLAIVSMFGIYLRNIFMTTSRSIKRLEGVTRSPVFSHINASLNGLTTLRVSHMEDKLIEEFDHHQDLHSSAYYLFLGTNRAFGYWLDQLCLIFITAVTFGFLIGSHLGVFGGNVGLAITQAISLTGMLQWGMRQEAEVENQMTSVERVLEYSHLPAEPPMESQPDKKPDPLWPKEGRVEFKELYLSYNTEDPPVLKNLNVEIKAGEKVGIVGRTGAGKSSLISAIFRLEDLQGRIAIDDLDTGMIGVHDLRKKLSIIPQEPVLFNASLRKNLDPFDEHPDDAIWSALQETELKEVVDEMGYGLQSGIHEGGANLSVGLRQLVCLARAILRNNRILILDEATANVDPHTDQLIQKMIRNKFKECTVLTIAHRLHTIMDSDKVLVMDSGSAVEFDHPHILLKNTNGLFYKMVQQVGGTTAQSLVSIAEESYLAREATASTES